MSTIALIAGLIAVPSSADGGPGDAFVRAGARDRGGAIHRLADGSLLEGLARITDTGVLIRTPFGDRLVPKASYLGEAQVSVTALAQRYTDLTRHQADNNVEEHRAYARWCLENGYQTGLREQLNAILRRDVDDAWARGVLGGIAEAYIIHPSEGSLENRDQRKLVDFLFLEFAAKDNVAAVLAGEKARHLDPELTLTPAIKALRSASVRARWMGAFALRDHRGPEFSRRVRPLYDRSLSDASWAVRREAVRAFAGTNDQGVVRLYTKQLQAPDGVVRVRAAEALGELGDRAALSMLTAALADTWRPRRVFIASTRQVAYVKDYDVEVAQSAFIADPVVDVVQDGSVLDAAIVSISVERHIYHQALRRISGVDLGDRAEAWEKLLK